MAQTKGKIIKGNQIHIDGKYQLGFSQVNHNSPESMNTTLKSPRAKIIENNLSYVVIQVTCSCGKQITIRGEYNETEKQIVNKNGEESNAK